MTQNVNEMVTQINTAARWAEYENTISNGYDIAAGAEMEALRQLAEALETQGAVAALFLATKINDKAKDQMDWDIAIRPNAGRRAAVRKVREILAA